MVRNKSQQGQDGLNDSRKGNLSDNKQTTKINREQLDNNEQRGDPRKADKGALGRKGSSKTDH